MWLYSETVTEHFARPRNAGVLANANAVGLAGALRFGAAVKLMLNIEPETRRIATARFQSYGCGSAIATSSALTEMVTGLDLDEAASITPAALARFLGGLPVEKMYCAVLAYEALQEAIANYRMGAEERASPALVCKCLDVSEALVARAVRMNALTTPDEVCFYTKAGGCCLACFKQVEALLARLNAEMAEQGVITKTQIYKMGSATPRFAELVPRGNSTAAPDPIALNALAARMGPRPMAPKPPGAASAPKRIFETERERMIDAAIEDLRSYFQRDGGDCELVAVEGNVVHVRLTGACVGCQLSSKTLSGVQEKLAHKLGESFRVVPVQ